MGSYDAGYGFAQGVDSDRVNNLKRAISAVEQRIAGMQAPMGAAYGGYGQPAYAPPAADLGVIQDQINRLSAQIAQPQYHAPPAMAQMAPMAPPAPPQPDLNAMAAEIAQRQQALSQQAQKPAPSADLSEVLAALQGELLQLKQQVAKPVAVQQSVSQAEIDRIAKAVSKLQSGVDEKTLKQLGKGLEELRETLKQDVRRTVRREISSSNGNQVTEFDKRLQALAQDFDSANIQNANSMAPRVEELAEQLGSIRSVIDDLPQTLAITRLEKRMSEIAAKIDKVSAPAKPVKTLKGSSSKGNEVTSKDIKSIEGRLDEVARALVAVSNAHAKPEEKPLDLSGIDRVEARLSELGRVVDEISGRDSSEELKSIAVRIDGLTERLGSFEKYAESGDLGGASAMFAAPDVGQVEESLRLINSRLDEMAGASASAGLEEQVQRLSQQVEEAANRNSTAAQMSNLEAQVGQILRQLGKGGGEAVNFGPVEERLGQIEHQLVSNQNFSLEAAQQAAQHAVSLMGASSEPGQIVNSLSQDLQALQQAAENTNAQNTQIVMGVQQTMQQVVDRLGSLEMSLQSGNAVRQAQTVQSVEQTVMAGAVGHDVMQPGFAADGLAGVVQDGEQLATMPGTIGPDPNAMPPGQPMQVAAPPLDPSAQMEHPMGTVAENHAPLEPGSQSPDLDRMVEQARVQLDEAKASLMGNGTADGSMGVDEIQPDAVAAARRALQATTAEMDAVKDEMTKDKKGSKLAGKASGLLPSLGGSRLKKPILMGAAALLLAIVAFKGVGMFLGDDGKKVAKTKDKKPAAQKVEKSAAKKPVEVTKDGAVKVDVPAAKPADAKQTQARIVGEDVIKPAGNAAATTAAGVADGAATPQAEQSAQGNAQPGDTKPADQMASDTGASDTMAPDGGASDTMASDTMAPQPEVKTDEAQLAATAPQGEDAPSGDAEAGTDNSPLVEEARPVETADASSKPEQKTQEAAPAAEFDVDDAAGPPALVAAARSGDPKALFQLGMRYSDGGEVKRDMTQAAKWFALGAEKGFAPAQYSIGSLHEKGIGVERDIIKAAGWYEKAAMQGNARAMHNLAVIYAMGNPPEVQPNMDKAVKWFRQAADLGIKDSQFNLGILYGQGMGVPQNLGNSYKWFALAAKTGDGDAASKRDEVAAAMGPDELDDAKRLVNSWSPKKLAEGANRVAIPKNWRGKSSTQSSSATSLNDQVKKAQALLNQRGFSVGSPDGLLGPKTKRAIMEFQRSAGLPITGKIDSKLLQALDVQT